MLGAPYIADFAGNAGALSDGQFEWNEERDAYVCDQATYDWWAAVVKAIGTLLDITSANVYSGIHGR